MLRRIALFVLSLGIITGAVLAVAPAAQAYNPFGEVCKAGTGGPVCDATGGDPLGGKNGVIKRFSLLFSVLAGIVAVIVIIVAGIRFITSGGDPEQVKRAKRTIVYASIGLIAIIVSGTLINFIIGLL